MSRFVESAAGAAPARSVLAAAVRGAEEKVPLDQVPKPALDAAKKRFPAAVSEGASTETDKGKTVYEVTFTQNGK
jgi:pyruvate kinase